MRLSPSGAKFATQDQLKLFNSAAKINVISMNFITLISNCGNGLEDLLVGKKTKLIIFSLLTLGFLTMQLVVSTSNVTAYERPQSYFKVVLIVPNTKPERVKLTQVIATELWKIGIDAEIAIMGWDAFTKRYGPTDRPYAEGGWDISFFGWRTGFWGLEIYTSKALWKQPAHLSILDQLVEYIVTEPDLNKVHESILQVLDIAVWENHAFTGLYQEVQVRAWDAALQGWFGDFGDYASLYFENKKQTTLIDVSPYRFSGLNPAISGHDSNFFAAAFSELYQKSAEGIYYPLLAAADPIPLGSNELISKYVDLATIHPDSPFNGATDLTNWGDNPNVDPQFNATKAANDYSMFLVRLREGIPWHPGYGYTADMKLNVTADDLVWNLKYYLNLGQEGWKIPWGAEASQAIEKINETLVKFNFRGLKGNGFFPQWRDELAGMPILPRHILDPTFNATIYGGGMGVTPDGTEIPSYELHEYYRFNTGQGNQPLLGNGPYSFKRWDESHQLATFKKFADWGGYGNNSLWQDIRFLQNNIDRVGIQVMTDKFGAQLDLETDVVDMVPPEFVGGSDVPYLARQSNIQVHKQLTESIQIMNYNTQHHKLNNRYVRLAISHLVPRDRIVQHTLGGLGEVNEVVGVGLQDLHYPADQEWEAIGLQKSENVEDSDSGETLEFQGHIRYNLPKAWALMEKAGYDMAPFREAVRRKEAGERAEQAVEPLSLLLASGVAFTIVGAILVLSRHYWERHQLARGSKALRLSHQRKELMDAIALKQSPRISEKAQAQEIFRQVANDEVLSPDLTIYAMLNLCDMLLDEAKAYGEQVVFREAEKLSSRVSDIAREQESGSLRVEALLLHSKFALLRGDVTQADNLLEQAFVIAKGGQLPKLTEKVAQEQSSLQKEVVQWEKLVAEAASLRERLEYARLQDYIANAVRVIEESAHLDVEEVRS
ncbi:MAG: ABC transporter substrate-binding protein [Candidatus Hodarchaeota archaeon]